MIEIDEVELIDFSSSFVFNGVLVFLSDIQTKLEELIASNPETIPMQNYEPYRLLREMREQQDINERTLLMLGRRLRYHGR